MANIAVRADIRIAAPAAIVRRQFGDVAHHEREAPHRGVEFSVLDESDGVCTYAQTTAVGPLRLRQTFRLVRSESGPLVNEVTSGMLEGGTITFEVTALDDETSTVVATVDGPLHGVRSLAAPLLRRATARSLAGALVEDKQDIESGNYGRKQEQ